MFRFFQFSFCTSVTFLLISCGGGSEPRIAVNSAPVANDVQVTTTQGMPVSGTLDATDANGDTLTFSIDNRAPNLSKGTIMLDDEVTGDFTYTPLAQETGLNSYLFKANDGQADSNDATVSIMVNPSAAGVWIGKFVSNTTAQERDVVAIVAADNQADFLVDGRSLYSGLLDTTGTGVTASLTAFAGAGATFPDGSTFGALALDGLVEPGTDFTGTYSGVGEDGSFTLNYDAVTYERTPVLSDLNAQWSVVLPSGFALEISFDDQGNLLGSDSDGCQYDGFAALVSPVTNVYRLEVEIRSCGDRDGSYTGLASLVSAGANVPDRCLACEQSIMFGISSQTHGLVGRLDI